MNEKECSRSVPIWNVHLHRGYNGDINLETHRETQVFYHRHLGGIMTLVCFWRIEGLMFGGEKMGTYRASSCLNQKDVASRRWYIFGLYTYQLIMSHVTLSVCLCIFICMFLCMFLFSLSLYLFTSLPLYLSICPNDLSIYLTICLSVYLSICLSIYPVYPVDPVYPVYPVYLVYPVFCLSCLS